MPTGSRGRKRKEKIPRDPREQKLVDKLESSLWYYQKQSREMETKNVLLREQIRKLEKEKAELLSDLKKLLGKYQ